MADEFEKLRQLKLQKPVNYYTYWGLEADFSRRGLISPADFSRDVERGNWFANDIRESL
ncbi:MULTISPECIES: hypothetical protein [Nostoc]|uniref:Uncharacterized protein n=2 Tax=Nostoc TaxID=1177 RepID=A0ABR8IL29_9NOSO|nr:MULTISPECIES: hypothetical protein [Nostoc]MBD2563820.1 hypothetical protein [Nostoc linckia FACHB-391]MBD2651589.1 hypothetical protein [Nostoc foliaceum FACHB-393]